MSKGKTVHVSSAQKQAARAIVSRGTKSGRSLSTSVAKIRSARDSRTAPQPTSAQPAQARP